ncbi:MAG: hypothetical protein Q8R48_06505 [Candidatus Omnitrophota bacterium]|nr:hypothetical protein [Candidatus Omnitrophota bacterium]
MDLNTKEAGKDGRGTFYREAGKCPRRIALILLAFTLLSASAYSADIPVDENVRVFLNNLEESISKMDAYKCRMVSENWKGKKHESKIMEFYFKKPNLMRMDVLEGDKAGSVVLLNKEGKIRGKNSMGMRKTLKPTDNRLKNIRGATFMQSSLWDMMDRLRDHILERGCKATLTEEENMLRPSYRLRVEHKDADDPVMLEEVWYDKSNYFIMKKIKHEGNTKVTDIVWEDCQINIPLDDGLFVQ